MLKGKNNFNFVVVEEEDKISLQRHRRHKKIRPWKNVVRILIFLGLLLGLYYFLTELVNKAAEKQQQENTENPNQQLEVPIDVESMDVDSLKSGDTLN